MTDLSPIGHAPRRIRLRIDDYMTLDRAGAFAAYGKTELLDGEVTSVNAQHRPHGRVKMALYNALHDALRTIGSPLAVAVEVSVALSEHDAPEPDLTLTSEPDGEGMIPAASVALIVEVSDTTLDHDLGRKHAAYARAGVPEYWVADVNAAIVQQFWAPIGEVYSQRQTIAFGDRLKSATIDSLAIYLAVGRSDRG